MSSIVTEGNITADAELRYTQTGKPVAHATLAVTDRIKADTGEWADGATSFYDLTVWGAPAEPFAQTATKGARLLVAGQLDTEEYRDRDGNTRTRRRITAEHTGLSLRFHPAARRETTPDRD